MSAKMRKAGRRFNEEDTFKIVESKEHLSISYRGGNDVFKIKLRQGFRLIEPSKVIKPGSEGHDSGERVEFIVAGFPYSKLDPNAKTTILVIRGFGEDEYEVDFSSLRSSSNRVLM